MDDFLSNSDDYNLKYNCTMYTQDQWDQYRSPSKIVGAIYFFMGTFYVSAYILCLFGMSSKRFLSLPCYKLMFFNGFADIGNLINGSIIGGIYEWNGYLYCDYPNFIYISGALCLAFWCIASMDCMILSTNRCLDLVAPRLADFLFKGWRIYLWIIFSFLYGMWFAFYTSPFIFSAHYFSVFVDPFAGTPLMDLMRYANWPHAYNNIVVIIVLIVNYTTIVAYIIVKDKSMKLDNTKGAKKTMSKMQKQIIIQAASICMCYFIAASYCVKMQFYPSELYVVFVEQLIWQSSHGGSVFIYLFLNQSLRTEIRKKLGLGSKVQQQTTDRVATLTTNTKESN